MQNYEIVNFRSHPTSQILCGSSHSFFLFGMTNLTGSARRTGCSGGGGGAGSSGAGCCGASADPPTSSPRGRTHPDRGPGHRGGPHHEAQGQQGKKEHEVMIFSSTKYIVYMGLVIKGFYISVFQDPF